MRCSILLVFYILVNPVTQVFSDPLGGDEWNAVRDIIQNANKVPDTSVLIGNVNGRMFDMEKGQIKMDMVVPIASATKWFTGVVILRLVQDGIIGLEDNPQKYLDWYTKDSSDKRTQVTIRQLLGFTSGFTKGAVRFSLPCIYSANSTIKECAKSIYDDDLAFEPGTTFIYGPSHHQILGAVAEAATGISWNEIFDSTVKIPLNMTKTFYGYPSPLNPRLDGGAYSNAIDFEKFLLGLLTGKVLNSTMMEIMAEDNTPTDKVKIPYAFAQHHYGASVWLRCMKPTWDETCEERNNLFVIGLYGFFAWMDRKEQTYGVMSVFADNEDMNTVPVSAFLIPASLNVIKLERGNTPPPTNVLTSDPTSAPTVLPTSQVSSSLLSRTKEVAILVTSFAYMLSGLFA